MMRYQRMGLKQVGSFTMAQMGQSKSVVGEFMKQKRKVNSHPSSFCTDVKIKTILLLVYTPVGLDYASFF